MVVADSATEVERKRAFRLPHLDGIRAIAALYVVMYHALREADYGRTWEHFSSVGWAIAQVLRYGHFAVGVFIVVSGYCLALPIARRQRRELGLPLKDYLLRRARRILPPYYAALAISFPMIWYLAANATAPSTVLDYATPYNTSGAIVSHLLLVHNFLEAHIFTINPPLWSIAVECQLYLLFPLFVLVWRRFGFRVVLPIGFAIGCVYTIYAFLFTLGMAAAALSFMNDSHYAALKRRVPWLGVTAGALVLFFIHRRWQGAPLHGMEELSDCLVGLAAASLLVYLADNGTARVKLPLLSHPWLVFIGTMSYSLYLLHQPMLGIAHMYLQQFTQDGDAQLVTLLICGLVGSISVAYLFHLLVERAFMSAPAKASAGRSDLVEKLAEPKMPAIAASAVTQYQN